MNRSEWNRKVALSRWSKVHKKENDEILNNEIGVELKSIIFGFLAGDGCIKVINKGSYKKYEVDFYPDDLFMLNKYIECVKTVYNKTPKISKKGNMFIAKVSSKTFAEDLIKNAKFGIQKWEIPLNKLTNKKLKINWIKAFFSAEGYVNNKVIRVQTVNNKGMTQLSNLLNQLRIDHGFYEYSPLNKNFSKVYIISIGKKKSRERFYRCMGFFHSKKMETLKRAVS